jgi:hypothetical protein
LWRIAIASDVNLVALIRGGRIVTSTTLATRIYAADKAVEPNADLHGGKRAMGCCVGDARFKSVDFEPVATAPEQSEPFAHLSCILIVVRSQRFCSPMSGD